MIAFLERNHPKFFETLADKLTVSAKHQTEVRQRVEDIILSVCQKGDQALLHYADILDGTKATKVSELSVPTKDLKRAWDATDNEAKAALKVAHDNIAEYGEYQKLQSWQYTRTDGSILGQQVMPLDSAGIYVPGGKAAYPSSVLMNAIPAKVAGVKRIVMVVPTPGGIANPLVLATAYLCGVDEVWKIGGAHAVAALAYGTETIQAVDKITGPGNQYVAEAKRYVFGQVGIDMIAGPSEIVIIADDSANPDWVAADLFAQAEHDEMAQSIFITYSRTLADKVIDSIHKLLPSQPRSEIINRSLTERGVIILCETLEECLSVANYIAPEHLELMIQHPETVVHKIKHAGAIFVGEYSNEVFGDYCAGTNHVLPTSRTARFASPLGVYDFQKRIGILQLSRSSAHKLSPIADCLAQREHLYAHAFSARLRGKSDELH
ncbi:histidinol dehydrogenase [Suttonella ornithocola]|uniref:Histidinol dehydrogenase n=1 Tax=Suttonella ornithocola TaxID=279832 RepID=A0A380MVJ6_9GAMM|nr:histidinol dehydrogenase [Suttonella ornithocola]SUO96610.1 Histidinol dehydrogenase [Suttonella ornithocola]